MFLLVGLGNPGAQYERTRHNVGFKVLDLLHADLRANGWREKFKGLTASSEDQGNALQLLKPLTFMNLSGESVQAAMAFHKVLLANVIVVHDELDVPFGEIRLKIGGGAGGHNGIKSIAQHCGADFCRIRVGIGRPPAGIPTDRFVLSGFSEIEGAELTNVLPLAARAALGIVHDGLRATQNKFHTKSNPTRAT